MDRRSADDIPNLGIPRNSHFLGTSNSSRRRGQSLSFAHSISSLWYTGKSCADGQMIFWGYLIRAIRNPNNACAAAPRVWIKAPCFRVWIAISVSTGLLLFGATSIEIKDLDAQRVRPSSAHERRIKVDNSVIPLHRNLWNLFGVSFCDRIYIRVDDRLSFGSFALAFYLPGFVNRMKDFGAGFEMQERLAVFQEINFMRTLSRVAYAICFVRLSSPSKV
jgi:hypothetical protein